MQLHSNPFARDKDVYAPLLMKERALMAGFALTAVAGCFSPVLWPSQNNSVKLIQMIYGLFSGGCFTTAALVRQQKEKTYQAIATANHKIVTEHLKGVFTFEQSRQQIEAKREVAQFVNSLPIEERSRWVQQYGLHGLVDLPVVQQEAVIDVKAESPQLAPSLFNPSQSSFDQISDDLSTPVDYTWMDAKFINASKAVFGPKGSGKSVYLAYEAIAFLTHYPEGELRIGDKHFDEDESQWLPGVPTDILLNQYVAKKPDQILAMFQRAKQLLDHRIENGIKQNHPECRPFKLICDEFEGFIMQLSDAQKTDVMSIIAQTQDEGRKYLINITLGMHSLKKERIGVDSSVLFQMDVLCLGSALADPNTKFPADFEAKALLQKQMELQRNLKKSQGFACVARKLGEMAKVEVIPFLDLSQFTFEITQDTQPASVQNTPKDTSDWLETIKQWANELGRQPTSDELKQVWKQLTNQELNSKGVVFLLEKLGYEVQDGEL
jgi:hypothetical protein